MRVLKHTLHPFLRTPLTINTLYIWEIASFVSLKNQFLVLDVSRYRSITSSHQLAYRLGTHSRAGVLGGGGGRLGLGTCIGVFMLILLSVFTCVCGT